MPRLRTSFFSCNLISRKVTAATDDSLGKGFIWSCENLPRAITGWSGEFVPPKMFSILKNHV